MEQTIHRGFCKEKTWGCKRITINNEQIIGHWQEGVYFKNIKRTPCPINDSLKDEDVAHFIIYNGMADWNLPSEMCKVEVVSDTVCRRIDNIVIDRAHPFEKDIVWFKYNSHEIDYIGIGYLEYDNDYNVIVVAGETKLPYKQIENVRIIGNIFENSDLINQFGLMANGLYGKIIHSYWDNSNGLTHYIVVEDGRGETWKFGGLNLEKNPCSKWVRALMDTFETTEISDSGLNGLSVFLAIEEGKPVALMYDTKIIDTRNFYEN